MTDLLQLVTELRADMRDLQKRYEGTQRALENAMSRAHGDDRLLTFAETCARVGRTEGAMYRLLSDRRRRREHQLEQLFFKDGRLWRSTERRIAHWIALRSGDVARRAAMAAAARAVKRGAPVLVKAAS